jgi:hypothetical protein
MPAFRRVPSNGNLFRTVANSSEVATIRNPTHQLQHCGLAGFSMSSVLYSIGCRPATGEPLVHTSILLVVVGGVVVHGMLSGFCVVM